MLSVTAKKQFTLVFVRDEPNQKILLGMKKRGFGHGRFNGLCGLLFSALASRSFGPYSSAARVGFGGKVEKGETVLEGAHRELEEEAFVTTHNLDRVGMLLFTFANDPIALEVHVYSTTSYSGDPKESEEMKPEWFSYSNIPFESMWPDDKYWIPIMLKGKLFTGRFDFAEDQTTILKEELHTIEELPIEWQL